jgi:hypothetical protein
MALDYEIKKPHDLTKINPNEMGELLWWSYILNISPEKLLATIDDVGTSLELVKKKLHG